MTYMGNLTTGDRVRVTFEADVRFGTSFGVDLEVGNGVVTLREETWAGVEFEKVPPIERFKPGDVVRLKNWVGDGGHIHLAYNGYINEGHTFYERTPAWMAEEFTSEDYERVALDD